MTSDDVTRSKDESLPTDAPKWSAGLSATVLLDDSAGQGSAVGDVGIDDWAGTGRVSFQFPALWLPLLSPIP